MRFPSDTAAIATREDVSWLSLLRTARVPYALLALVAAGLLLPPQMRDMLAAMRESASWQGWLAFPASLAVFGFLCWFWARAAIAARFDLPDMPDCWDEAVQAGRRGERPLLRSLPLHTIPEAPLPLAGLIGAGVAAENRAPLLGFASLLLMLVVWLLLRQRFRLAAWLGRTPPARLAPENPRLRATASLREFVANAPHRCATLLRRAPGGAWLAVPILIASIAAFIISAAVSLSPANATGDPRNLLWTVWRGPIPVLIGCGFMAGPVTLLAFVLDGLRLSFRLGDGPVELNRPPAISALFALALLAPHFTALHAIRIMERPLPPRPTLARAFAAWRSTCGPTARPVVVAISGGAARAALWGAAVLARIDQAEAGSDSAIFAISTVSGGSLGAGAYLAARTAGSASCRLPPASEDRFATYAKRLTAADSIGSLLAGFVLSDIPRSLVGWLPSRIGSPMRGGDRAAAIERAFETNAARAASTAHLATPGLDQPSLTLARPGLPLWFGNATERDTGARVVIAPIDGGEGWPFDGAADLLGQLGADLPISTAINVTARFPFLEPSAAATPRGSASTPGLALIDGGYYDQSGLETALEVADWLRAQHADPIVVVATGSGYAPSLDTQSMGSPAEEILSCRSADFRPDLPSAASMAADFLAPVIGLFSVRTGHVDALLRRTRAEWCKPQRFFHFYLGPRGREPVPLNWVLSKPMADHVWLSADHGPAIAEPADPIIAFNRREAADLASILHAGPAQ